MTDLRIGHGFDVHKLVDDRKLVLGGIEVPFEKGLQGHSDADVVVHALMDALLGAAGMGDIGKYFPPSDEQYKDADSIDLLRKVLDMLNTAGFGRILNVDITLMCEEPKMGPHFPRMKERLSTILTIEDLSRINLKATTTEGLGFTGRGEGIAATAVCLIERNA
jgi:2-C-methyl-D-erythritol 2,4-cyclodiphosphate synthase